MKISVLIKLERPLGSESEKTNDGEYVFGEIKIEKQVIDQLMDMLPRERAITISSLVMHIADSLLESLKKKAVQRGISN